MPFDAAVGRLDWAEAVDATDADAAAAAAERSVAAVLERITYANEETG